MTAALDHGHVETSFGWPEPVPSTRIYPIGGKCASGETLKDHLDG